MPRDDKHVEGLPGLPAAALPREYDIALSIGDGLRPGCIHGETGASSPCPTWPGVLGSQASLTAKGQAYAQTSQLLQPDRRDGHNISASTSPAHFYVQPGDNGCGMPHVHCPPARPCPRLPPAAHRPPPAAPVLQMPTTRPSLQS